MKYAPKLTALFISISAISAAVMFTIAYFQVAKILESEITARMENRVFFTMDALDRFLSERLSDISVISHDPVINSGNATAEQITERLIFFRNAYKCYVSLSFFNLERIRIADTAGMNIGEQNRMTRYWEDVLSGNVSAASDVSISEEFQVPIVYFASAVNNKEGKIVGVVVARILTSRLFEMIKGSAGIQEEEEEEEEIDLINKDGLLIYSNHNRAGILKENLPERESIKIAQQEKIFGSVKYRNPDEKEAEIHAFCREKGYLDFKGNGWTIISNVSTRVIFGPVNKLLKMFIIMFLAMLPVLALVIYLFSKTVSRPLVRLSFAAAEIGKGKLDTVIEVKSKDEFGSLANTFNEMAADLKKTTTSIDNLNKEIAERKRIDEVLRESEERYRIQFEQTIDALFLADTQTGIILECNRAAMELIGREKSEMVGQHQRILHPSEEWDGKFSKSFKQHIIGETFVETKVIKKSGEIRDVAIKASTFDLKGKKVILAIFRDITERKKAEEALKEAKAFTENTLNSITDFFYSFDLNGKFLSWNKTFNRISGYSDQELSSKKPIDFFLGEDIQRIAEAVERIYKEGSSKVEANFVIKDGRQIPCEFTGSILKDSKGNIIGFSGTGRDLTERKKAEEALWASEMKHRTLLENLPQKIFRKDRNSVYVSCNENYAHDLKIKPEEIAGRTDLEFYPKELAEKYRTDDKRIMESGKTEDIEEKYIQDGEERFVHTTKTPVKDEQGNVVGIFGIFWDITEHRKADEELKLAYKKLRQTQQELIQSSKMAAMGQLASGISHELNQPLTGIKGFAQAVLMDLEKESPFRNDLNKIVGQVDRMDAIIKNMRFFARKSDFNMVELDINQVVSNSLMLLNQQLKVHNIRVIQELGPDIPKIQGDPNQLQQAFLNIISNARDAILGLNRPEGGEIRIRTSLSQDKKHIEINFQDTGGGIPDGNLQHIFSPFFTTKSPDKGMGLGLSITYRIIENHQGKIEFKSKEGQGTTFNIVFPLQGTKHKIKQS